MVWLLIYYVVDLLEDVVCEWFEIGVSRLVEGTNGDDPSSHHVSGVFPNHSGSSFTSFKY